MERFATCYVCRLYACTDLFVCFRREKTHQQKYRRVAQEKAGTVGKLQESRKELNVVKEKLQKFAERDESLQSLRRAANLAEMSVREMQQDMQSLEKERDRAVERFVCTC